MATPAKDWPHAPIHRFESSGIYMVTGATLYKQLSFRGPEKLSLLENKLLSLAKRYQWQLEAWSVFSNHYHFVGRRTEKSLALDTFLSHLHTSSAVELNQLDACEGRNVWYNYWDSKLTFERSYLARLNYVHQNPVKHLLVPVAHRYPWCSAAWFERTASPAAIKMIYSFKTDQLKVYDDY
jgi:putative transposase